MNSFRKTVIIFVMLALLLATWQAYASLPSDRGISAPKTVWSERGITGTVSGKVVTSMDQSKGVEGAYVALVDSTSPWREYANTTTDANGNYKFTKVNATYSSVLFRGPDGGITSYQPGSSSYINVYMIYANMSDSEGYSSPFGVDTNHSNNPVETIILYTGIPSAEPTPEPTEEPQPTPVVTPEPPTPTPEPTPVPAAFPVGLLLGGAAILVILAVAALAAYFLYPRIKEGRGGKNKRKL